MSLKITTEAVGLLDMIGITYGPELHTDANAASDPNGNEADATTGWTSALLAGTGANVFESQGAVKNTGSYAIHADANDTPSAGANCRITLTVENGASYRVTFDWRHIGSNGDWKFVSPEIGSGTLASMTSAETTFTSVDVTVVAVSTSLVVGFLEDSATNNGGIYIDNVSVRKVL